MALWQFENLQDALAIERDIKKLSRQEKIDLIRKEFKSIENIELDEL